MLCQRCGKNEANVSLTQIINGNKSEMKLCSKCANLYGGINTTIPFDLGNLFEGLFEIPEAKQRKILKCDKCGLTYDEFKKQSKFGCDECYTAFNDRLVPVLKRLHGNVKHTGKLPSAYKERIEGERELARLKEELEVAIKNEEFEKAAELRDKIKALKK